MSSPQKMALFFLLLHDVIHQLAQLELNRSPFSIVVKSLSCFSWLISNVPLMTVQKILLGGRSLDQDRWLGKKPHHTNNTFLNFCFLYVTCGVTRNGPSQKDSLSAVLFYLIPVIMVFACITHGSIPEVTVDSCIKEYT